MKTMFFCVLYSLMGSALLGVHKEDYRLQSMTERMQSYEEGKNLLGERNPFDEEMENELLAKHGDTRLAYKQSRYVSRSTLKFFLRMVIEVASLCERAIEAVEKEEASSAVSRDVGYNSLKEDHGIEFSFEKKEK